MNAGAVAIPEALVVAVAEFVPVLANVPLDPTWRSKRHCHPIHRIAPVSVTFACKAVAKTALVFAL